jgi:excinuclease ABC subunit C
MSFPKHLKEKLERVPKSPGVYLFRNERGKIIYIGKAKVLRNRVRSYFQKGDDGRGQYENLTRAIHDLEIIVTDNELEAMILESSLVRHHSPRYNVSLRDDKSLPYLKITNELYPRIFLTRRPTKDGSRYYGPFTDVMHMKRLLKTLKEILNIRKCNLIITQDSINRKKHRVCIYYDMGQCGGPCEGKVSAEWYAARIEMFLDFLRGKTGPLSEDLTRQMQEKAENQEFERAAEVRDQIKVLEQLTVHQKVISPFPVSRDVIALAREEDDACAVIFRIRNGRLIGRIPFFLKGVRDGNDLDILQAFLEQVYQTENDLPDELHLPDSVPDLDLLAEWMSRKKGKKIIIEFPKIGDKAKLMKLARENALLLLGERRLEIHQRETVPQALTTLKESLHLPRLPKTIEAFDVSNLHGQDAVASMVVFHHGRPQKSHYRHFKIRNVTGIDDFAMMAEVIGRRYRRLKMEGRVSTRPDFNGGTRFTRPKDIPTIRDVPPPDLILVDGGKGQLNAAKQVLNTLELPDIPIIGLAKRLEEVFVPGDPEPMILAKTSPALKLLQQVRNEAHRFAIQYHRKLRGKRISESALDKVAGIGPIRRKILLQKFGSIKRLKAASLEEISSLPGISKTLAEAIWQHLSISD